MRVVLLANNGGGAGLVILHYNAPHNCLLPYMEHNREASQPVTQPESDQHQHHADDIFIPTVVSGVVSYQWQVGWLMVVPGVEVTILG